MYSPYYIVIYFNNYDGLDNKILSYVACPAESYFSTISHKWHDFREKVTEHKICAVILSVTYVSNSSHSKEKERDIITVRTFSFEVPVILVRF